MQKVGEGSRWKEKELKGRVKKGEKGERDGRR